MHKHDEHNHEQPAAAAAAATQFKSEQPAATLEDSMQAEGTVSPDHVLESSTTTTGSGTDRSSPGAPIEERLGQSMFTDGCADLSQEDDVEFMHRSLTTNGLEHSKKKSRPKRQPSVHALTKSISKGVKGVKRAASQHMRRSNVKPENSGPSPVSPVMTQDWDPTCLLEELYSDFQPNTQRTNASGESARYYGYLEKLPKNATKPSVMKGWKRRYFRVMDDKVFYYEERTSPKALGFVRLSASKILLIPEKNQIQIQEKKGQSIMLKARDKEDAMSWHRSLMLEAAHPTVSVPVSNSLQPDHEQQTVLIVDIGAASVRAGFAWSKAYPEVFFPAVASIDSTNYDPLASGNTALLPDNRYGAYQVYPRKHQLRMDKHDSSNLKLRAVSCILDSIVTDLGVEPESTEVILTLPPTVPEEQRNELVELLFETFQFSAICFQNQCLLALYSYNTTAGVVVNIGEHIDVVPIIDGYIIEAGVSHLPHGGNAITESLSKLITNKGIRYFSETEMYIVRLIKEELCYVSQDFDGDFEKCDANPALFTRATDVDRFQLPDHRKVIALDVECFKAPEGLFNPGIWGKDVPGLQDLVWTAVQACPIDQRRAIAKKIFLSGGTTLLPGLKERLQAEVTSLVTTGLTVEVHDAPPRQHAAFLGASVLSTLGSFQNYLVTREEFTSLGFEALRKWSTF
jgi:actin-related protein